MQGLADGYFVIPYTIGEYLAPLLRETPVPTDDPVFHLAETSVHEQVRALLAVPGTKSVDHYHRELGKVLWDNCGMSRSEQSLTKALTEIPAIREEFHANVRVLGGNESRNQALEKAGRVADYLEFAELLCKDALHREESCGGHFREEHQTDDGEALRDDDRFAYVAAWEWAGAGNDPVLHEEQLVFENLRPSTRSYK
jgi:succinate dehydrogenase / fumarate reductase flavoprotein subunit